MITEAIWMGKYQKILKLGLMLQVVWSIETIQHEDPVLSIECL